MSLVTRCDKCKREHDNISNMEELQSIGKFRLAYITTDSLEHSGAIVDLCVPCYKEVRKIIRTWLHGEQA